MKKYFAVKDQPNQFIKVSTGYDLGGHNVWNGNHDCRGYRVYVQPVTRRDDGMESCILFDGFKQTLVEVKRASKKAEAQAEELAGSLALSLAIQCARKKGWTLEVEG